MAPARLYSPDKEQEIIKRYLAGEKIVVLMTEYGCSHGYVNELVKRYKIPFRGYPGRDFQHADRT